MKRLLRSAMMIASLVTITLGPDPARAEASAVPDNIRLTWSESPKTTQTIGWRTDTTVMEGKVQYSAREGTWETVAASPPARLETNVGTIHLFSVTLRNLKPGTRYRYRVGDGKTWSPTFAFETEKAQPDKFEFLVFGDAHEKKPDYDVWRKTATEAHRQNPGAKFIVSLGDLIYAGRDYQQWQAWFAACQSVVAKIPDMPVIGDHEPRGLTSKDEWQRPDYFVRLFRVPQNGPANLKGEVYSFDYGGAHFAVLNSSFHYEFDDPAARRKMIEDEVAWLDADLSANSQPWKIVLYHDATYNLESDRAGTLTKKHFGPVIDKHHVDVVFNGHDHAMARSYYIRDEAFVAGPSEGTVYFISGRSGNNAKDSLVKKVWHPFFHDPQAQPGYLVAAVERDRLEIRTRLQDGTTVDTLVIDRRNPGESTPVVPFGAYENARFAAFGSLLPSGKPPQKSAAGEWFVDINALAAAMSGTFDRVTGTFAYDQGEIKLTLVESMFLDGTKEMVSLSGLTSVGFYCRYHPAMNLVMVERWRD